MYNVKTVLLSLYESQWLDSQTINQPNTTGYFKALHLGFAKIPKNLTPNLTCSTFATDSADLWVKASSSTVATISSFSYFQFLISFQFCGQLVKTSYV